MTKDIPIYTAKQQLPRIDGLLGKRHLLIGGLAVNQYVRTRRSIDIDLVCDDTTAQNILKKLWPSDIYKHTVTGTEYRPSYTIKKRNSQGEFGIQFGPKILERDPYPNLSWDVLLENGRPFRMDDNTDLENIIVPSVAGLIYAKMISFIARNKENPDKRAQDLDDFTELSNCEFDLADFAKLITHADTPDLYAKFLALLKTDEEKEIFTRSSLSNFSHIASEATVTAAEQTPEIIRDDEQVLSMRLSLSPRRLTNITWIDERRFAVCGATGEVCIVDAIGCSLLSKIQLGGGILRAITHLSGTDLLICGGDDGDLNLVDISNGSARKLHNAGSHVYSICVSADNTRVFTTVSDGHVDYWKLLEVNNTATLELTKRLYSFDNTPAFCSRYDEDNEQLFVGGQTGQLVQISLADYECDVVKTYVDTIFSLELVKKSLAVGTTGGELWFHRLTTNGSIAKKGDQKLLGHRGHVSGLSMDQNGSTIFSCSKDTSVRVWDIASETNASLYYSDDYMYDIKFSPDQSKLVSVDGVGKCVITLLRKPVSEFDIGSF